VEGSPLSTLNRPDPEQEPRTRKPSTIEGIATAFRELDRLARRQPAEDPEWRTYWLLFLPLFALAFPLAFWLDPKFLSPLWFAFYAGIAVVAKLFTVVARRVGWTE
jgi:hypothetical protein